MYYLVYAFLYLLSLLPMRILYIISDFCYVLVYYIIGYRKKITLTNLAIAFPDRSLAERIEISKQFYKNFADNFIETVKLFSATEKFISTHMVVDNPAVIESYYDAGRKCQLHLGHNFNWELANLSMPLITQFEFLVVYMPVESKLFDRLSMHIRSRTGSKLLPATTLSRAIIPYRKDLYLLTLVADQVPGDFLKAYWIDFFGQPTPFMQAPERGARIANIPVLFAHLYKTKRGHYHAVVETGAEYPAELPQGELTRRYVRFLERTISAEPSMWLWTHRRWKHGWKESYDKRIWIGKGDPVSQTAV